MAAAEDGISVPITISQSDPVYHATVESTVTHHNRLTISTYIWKRRWSIRAEEAFQNLALIEGDSDDLTQIIRAAHAWHDGTALTEIRTVAPFVHLTGRFEVPDNDPAQLTESEWQHPRIRVAEQTGRSSTRSSRRHTASQRCARLTLHQPLDTAVLHQHPPTPDQPRALPGHTPRQPVRAQRHPARQAGPC